MVICTAYVGAESVYLSGTLLYVLLPDRYLSVPFEYGHIYSDQYGSGGSGLGACYGNCPGEM